MTQSGLEVNAFHQMANSVNASRLTMAGLLMEVLAQTRLNSVMKALPVRFLLEWMLLSNQPRAVN